MSWFRRRNRAVSGTGFGERLLGSKRRRAMRGQYQSGVGPPHSIRARGAVLLLAACLAGADVGAQAPPVKLLLAYSSYREDLGYPRVYFYSHDGVGQGTAAGSIPPGTTRSDHRPSLTPGGKLCAWTSEVVGKPSQIGLWDVKEKKEIPLSNLGNGAADLAPSVSADGNLIAFSTWRRAGRPGGWDVLVYDRTAGAIHPDTVNSDQDDRMPALSADGRWLAFVSHRSGGQGLSDIYLCDLSTGKLVDLPGLNSAASEIEPSLSADGRLIAFVSSRLGGSGQRDIYLYDRQSAKLIPLTGLNSAAPEQTPSLSPDGRFIAFVSERLDGAGGRDLYLYDRTAAKLLPTPGLNSNRDDVDPSLVRME